jgi:hypothetical protein
VTGPERNLFRATKFAGAELPILRVTAGSRHHGDALASPSVTNNNNTPTSMGGYTMLKALTLGCSLAALVVLTPAMAQDWTKSKWGPDDEIGAANYLTPELALKAAQLVKTGTV